MSAWNCVCRIIYIAKERSVHQAFYNRRIWTHETVLEFLFERPWATKAKCSLYIARSYFCNEVDYMHIIFNAHNRSLKDCLARLEFAMVLVKTRRLPGRRRPEVPSTTSGSSPPTRSPSPSSTPMRSCSSSPSTRSSFFNLSPFVSLLLVNHCFWPCVMLDK